MYAYASNNGPAPLELDFLPVDSYPVGSSAYLSCVKDAGAVVGWGQLTWTGATPVGTGLALATRSSTGGTAWSGWSAVAGSGNLIASPAGRYLQYRATLTSSATDSPRLEAVNFGIASTPLPIMTPTTTATPMPSATATSTPTATSDGYTIYGRVCEFPTPTCGAMRGVTVTLAPLGWQTSSDLIDGGFSFAGVPDGSYQITVQPGCNPYGCYETTDVTVAGADLFVLARMRPLTSVACPTDTAAGPSGCATITPTITPTFTSTVTVSATLTATPSPTVTVTPTVTPTSLPGRPTLLQPADGAVLPQSVAPDEWYFAWDARTGPCDSEITITGPGGRRIVERVEHSFTGPSYQLRYTTDEYLPDDALGPWVWSVAVSCPLGSNRSETRTFSVERVPTISVTPTVTPSATLTATGTRTPTRTPSPTATPSGTPTATAVPTAPPSSQNGFPLGSVVGFNRPDTIEFLFFAAVNGDDNQTVLFYGRT